MLQNHLQRHENLIYFQKSYVHSKQQQCVTAEVIEQSGWELNTGLIQVVKIQFGNGQMTNQTGQLLTIVFFFDRRIAQQQKICRVMGGIWLPVPRRHILFCAKDPEVTSLDKNNTAMFSVQCNKLHKAWNVVFLSLGLCEAKCFLHVDIQPMGLKCRWTSDNRYRYSFGVVFSVICLNN